MNDNITILGLICITLILALCIIEYLKSARVIDTFDGTMWQAAEPVEAAEPVKPVEAAELLEVAQPVAKSCNSDSDCPIRFKCDTGFCKDKRPGKR